MAANKNQLQKILDLVGEFVTKQEGNWGHGEWESFLKKAAKSGAATHDEGKRNLGNILEASKFFYHRDDRTTDGKPAKAKAKSGAKKPAAKKAAVKKSAKKE